MKLEMHVHTRFSNDSLLPLWLIFLMCKIKKISCIAITDHNTIEGAVKFKEKFEKRNLKVIIGEEIMTSHGEIIGLFLEERVKSGMSPQDTIDEILRQRGIVYIPHPFDKKRNRTVLDSKYIKANLDKISFIEMHNGRNISEEYSIRQNEIAEKYGVIKVIGSDAHTFIELGRNYMKIENFNTTKEFITVISKSEIVCSPCLKICHTLTKFTKIIKFIIIGDLNGLFRIINKKFKK